MNELDKALKWAEKAQIALLKGEYVLAMTCICQAKENIQQALQLTEKK